MLQKDLHIKPLGLHIDLLEDQDIDPLKDLIKEVIQEDKMILLKN